MWFLQMAQLSTTMSHAHRATAFHCPNVNIGVANVAHRWSVQPYLLHLELLLPLGLLRRNRGIAHFDVSHGDSRAGYLGRSSTRRGRKA